MRALVRTLQIVENGDFAKKKLWLGLGWTYSDSQLACPKPIKRDIEVVKVVFFEAHFVVGFPPFLATHFPLHARALRWHGSTLCMIADMYIFLKHIFNSSYAGIFICLFWSKFTCALQV